MKQFVIPTEQVKSMGINPEDLPTLKIKMSDPLVPSAISSSKTPLIACAIMCKNEEPRICRTMDSVADYVELFVILDTGSTDKTKEVAKEYCRTKNKKLYLYEEPFVDFAFSRNSLLKKCKGKSEFILLMDANDEGKNPQILRAFLEHVLPEKQKCVFSTKYKLDNDVTPGATASYSRISVLRNGYQDEIYYEMPVHERITTTRPAYFINDCSLMFTEPTFYMYQDRALDKPSDERYERDIKVLEEYAEKNGYDERILHYLCQTVNNQGNTEKLFDYSERLTKYDVPPPVATGGSDSKAPSAEYKEYLFFGWMHNGISRRKLGKENYEKSLLKAYKYAKDRGMGRCEPLYILSVFYLQDWQNLGEALDKVRSTLSKEEIQQKEKEMEQKLEMGYELIVTACKIRHPKDEMALSTQLDLKYYFSGQNEKGEIVQSHRNRLREVYERLLYISCPYRPNQPRPNIKIQV